MICDDIEIMLREEFEATRLLYGKNVVSGICVNNISKDRLIQFVSENGNEMLSPTRFSFLCKGECDEEITKVCHLYGKRCYPWRVRSVLMVAGDGLITAFLRVRIFIFRAISSYYR